MRRLLHLKHRKLLAGPYLFWAVSFVIIPLLMIVYYGLTDKEGHFSFSNLGMMTSQENLKALGLALLLSLISTLICLVLAYPLAMILSEKNMNQTSFIVLIFILPMWMNFLLRTLAWQTLLEKNGVINNILHFLHLPEQSLINTPGAIVLGMVYNFLPFMILPIYNVLAIMKIIRTSESPEPVCQLLPCLNSCSMTFPIRRILLPPRRSEMTKVVRDGTKTIVIPLMTPGTLRGRMILKKVCILFAPRSLAA